MSLCSKAEKTKIIVAEKIVSHFSVLHEHEKTIISGFMQFFECLRARWPYCVYIYKKSGKIVIMNKIGMTLKCVTEKEVKISTFVTYNYKYLLGFNGYKNMESDVTTYLWLFHYMFHTTHKGSSDET